MVVLTSCQVKVLNHVLQGEHTHHRHAEILRQLSDCSRTTRTLFLAIKGDDNCGDGGACRQQESGSRTQRRAGREHIVDKDNPAATLARRDLIQSLHAVLTDCFDLRELAGQAKRKGP